MSEFSRRRFLLTLSASAAASVLLKGCLGNPPETSTTTNATPIVNPIALTPETTPETTQIKLGYLPIVEAAPLIIAKEKGFFAKYGMTEVDISKQANWGSARDNVEIGTAGGGIDGGQWQMPMPYLISEGLITKNNVKIPMYVLAQLNTQGNGIAIANKHKGKNIGLDLTSAKDYIMGLKAAGTPFKIAYTFPKANQDFWVKYWLAAGGINPDQDVNLIVVPAAQTVANMKTGSMDGFSTGDPWPDRIAKDNIGFLATLTAEMWPCHPEEYLAIRADWVDKNPRATKAVLKGVMEGSVSYPYKSHDLWFLTESVRWGYLPKDTLGNAKALIDQVNREDIWKEAAKEAGILEADIPTSTSRGVEKFFDGKVFDPENPQAYLDSLAIKKV